METTPTNTSPIIQDNTPIIEPAINSTITHDTLSTKSNDGSIATRILRAGWRLSTINYLRIVEFAVGLTAISITQPFCISFMVLLWIGDEKFKASLFLPDIKSTTLINHSGLFDDICRWSVISLTIGICSLMIAIFRSWQRSAQQGIADYFSSMYFADQLKRSFVLFYSIWLGVYWFEITVVFFGYIGKLMLFLYGKHAELDINSEHNTIGLCLLVMFVIFITIVDFVAQDILDWRDARRRPRCQRQE